MPRNNPKRHYGQHCSVFGSSALFSSLALSQQALNPQTPPYIFMLHYRSSMYASCNPRVSCRIFSRDFELIKRDNKQQAGLLASNVPHRAWRRCVAKCYAMQRWPCHATWPQGQTIVPCSAQFTNIDVPMSAGHLNEHLLCASSLKWKKVFSKIPGNSLLQNRCILCCPFLIFLAGTYKIPLQFLALCRIIFPAKPPYLPS